MTIVLGPRLRTIAGLVPTGSRIADIGSDHGYLPAWLLLRQQVSRAIAGELNMDPARRAAQTCEQQGLDACMEVRLGDGLQVLTPGEADAVIIAGMGGTTICRILEMGRHVLSGIRRLILQPNVAGSELRCWLVMHDWRIVDEALVEENGIIYEVIAAEQGVSPALDYLQALLGPVIMERRPLLLERRLRELLAERRHILSQLANSDSPQTAERRIRLSQECADLEALIE